MTREQRARMPAEWEAHEATWMAWPHDPLTWVAGVEAAEAAYVDMVRALSDGERVDLLVRDEAMRERVSATLAQAGAGDVRLHVVEYADSWVRDYGPTFVSDDGRLAAVDWTFNAWGGKYETLMADDAVGTWIADRAGVAAVDAGLVMEGGSIDVNGEGLLLTTKQCLLNANRNPGLDRAAIEKHLGDLLGVERVLWLGSGIVGDDTDGHVDDITRFVGPRSVVTALPDDDAHPDHEALSANLERLRAWSDQGLFELDVLPVPDPLHHDGEPVPASYANFYIGNEVVLVPTFHQPSDARALKVLKAHFPDRSVVPIDARPLVVGMGACHCLTQQQPAAAPSRHA